MRYCGKWKLLATSIFSFSNEVFTSPKVVFDYRNCVAKNWYPLQVILSIEMAAFSDQLARGHDCNDGRIFDVADEKMEPFPNYTDAVLESKYRAKGIKFIHIEDGKKPLLIRF